MKSVTITLNRKGMKPLVLDVDDARCLYLALHDLFGDKAIQSPIPDIYRQVDEARFPVNPPWVATG